MPVWLTSGSAPLTRIYYPRTSFTKLADKCRELLGEDFVCFGGPYPGRGHFPGTSRLKQNPGGRGVLHGRVCYPLSLRKLPAYLKSLSRRSGLLPQRCQSPGGRGARKHAQATRGRSAREVAIAMATGACEKIRGRLRAQRDRVCGAPTGGTSTAPGWLHLP